MSGILYYGVYAYYLWCKHNFYDGTRACITILIRAWHNCRAVYRHTLRSIRLQVIYRLCDTSILDRLDQTRDQTILKLTKMHQLYWWIQSLCVCLMCVDIPQMIQSALKQMCWKLLFIVPVLWWLQPILWKCCFITQEAWGIITLFHQLQDVNIATDHRFHDEVCHHQNSMLLW